MTCVGTGTRRLDQYRVRAKRGRACEDLCGIDRLRPLVGIVAELYHF